MLPPCRCRLVCCSRSRASVVEKWSCASSAGAMSCGLHGAKSMCLKHRKSCISAPAPLQACLTACKPGCCCIASRQMTKSHLLALHEVRHRESRQTLCASALRGHHLRLTSIAVRVSRCLLESTLCKVGLTRGWRLQKAARQAPSAQLPLPRYQRPPCSSACARYHLLAPRLQQLIQVNMTGKAWSPGFTKHTASKADEALPGTPRVWMPSL